LLERLSASRLWLVPIVALFCLPLFIELGRDDVQDDEAIYSFGVDRLLESGDWLAPKSSPHEDAVFLEKPPLKFWIVALPIKAGLLPHDEFGLRFWDALFGAAAFLYVFALGSRMAGAVCGAVAGLLLFVHWPLVVEHGLRTNNMEAALFLSYCGGVYHYLVWLGSEAERPTWRVKGHAYAAGLYFVLGFMTKFVAALFLPAVLGVVTLAAAGARARVFRSWRLWMGVSAAVILLCAPWFIYATLRFGSAVWQTMLAEHVYARFTAYLDPEHLHPWYYYPSEMYQRLRDSGAHVLAVAGLAVLLVQTWLRRWVDGAVVLTWALLPLCIMSFGTSKLYHYAYPFLPPVALAGGNLASLLLALAPVPFGRWLSTFEEAAARRAPGVMTTLRRPVMRTMLRGLAVLSIAIAIASVVYGPVRVAFGGQEVFRSSGMFRPALAAVVFGMLAGAARHASRAVVALMVIGLVPLTAYRETIVRLDLERSAKKTASRCILEVQAQRPELPRGVYLNLPDRVIGHPLYYYFRRVRPWIRPENASPHELSEYLFDQEAMRPILVWEPVYQEFRRDPPDGHAPVASPAMVAFGDSVLLLLPGPYADCSSDVPPPLRAQR
jgi:4-amino-4-deoxy-L-arabinose transferase-like glycosyltransferase